MKGCFGIFWKLAMALGIFFSLLDLYYEAFDCMLISGIICLIDCFVLSDKDANPSIINKIKPIILDAVYSIKKKFTIVIRHYYLREHYNMP